MGDVVSSGNYASKAGWNNTGKPNDAKACDTPPEPRGPGVFAAGLCCTCGRLTVHRDDRGMPRHQAAERAEVKP